MMKTKELCRQARVTAREVQWWCEARVIKAAFVDGRRTFDEEEALVAAIVGVLRRKGIPLQQIRRMRLRDTHGDFLVVNGAVRLRPDRPRWCSKEEVLPAVAAADGPCWVVDVGELRRQLQL